MALLDEAPRRVAQEKAQLEALAASVDWLHDLRWAARKDDGLEVSLTLRILERDFYAVLVYPSLFPDVPAYVRPSDSKERWSSHQYLGSGVLCLEWGPDTWHPGVGGADVLRSAYQLLLHERARDLAPSFPAVPSRHTETRGQAARGSSLRMLLTADAERLLQSIAPGAQLPLHAVRTSGSDAYVFVATRIGTDDVADVPRSLAKVGLETSGWAVVSAVEEPIGAPETLAALEVRLDALGCRPWLGPLPEGGHVLIVREHRGALRAFRIISNGEAQFSELHLVRATDTSARLPEAHSILEGKMVGIVGVGSVGSKIAVSLARSGLRKFTLVDDDILLPGNLVRHELDWAAVGALKTSALKQHLQLVAPGMEVIALDSRISAQENPSLNAIAAEMLGACDLLIDATANAHVFVTLAAIARRRQRALLWGELFAGGGAALMARSRPGVDLPPLELRAAVHAALERLPPAPDRKARSYDDTQDDSPLIGLDSQVGSLAAAMTGFSLDALLEPNSVEYPYRAYLLGYRRYWVFDQPLQVLPVACDTPTPDEESAALTTEEVAHLDQLKVLTSDTHATDNASS